MDKEEVEKMAEKLRQLDVQAMYEENEHDFLFTQHCIEQIGQEHKKMIYRLMKPLYWYCGIGLFAIAFSPSFLSPTGAVGFIYAGFCLMLGGIIGTIPGICRSSYDAAAKLYYVLLVNRKIAERKHHETKRTNDHAERFDQVPGQPGTNQSGCD